MGATLVRPEGADAWRPVTETHGKASSSKYANIRLRPGDRVRLIVPGGGGVRRAEGARGGSGGRRPGGRLRHA